LREANAYYSPEKKALLFGYFPALLANPGENLPGGLVFTCLSHDVVAHETTHALLDGLHRYFAEPSNPDVLAFHEAFADIVALLQHFTQPEALKHQIAKTRGDLASNQNLLGELAHQFGQAIGNHGALRDAIGSYNQDTKKWEPQEPDPELYQAASEPHSRGAILVAAMFDAFLSIYKMRIADLLRIATGGTGKLPEGNIHPDLVNRLAGEATKTAGHILRMAIRALDYCPPVDVTFGDYLRALITADWDLVPDDPWGYRIAVIEAFRRRGIYPRDVRTLSSDALRWQPSQLPKFDELLYKLKMGWQPNLQGASQEGEATLEKLPTLEWQTTTGSRAEIGRLNNAYQSATWAYLKNWLVHPTTGQEIHPEISQALGLCLGKSAIGTIYRSRTDGLPSLEVHSVRSARRPLQNGRTIVDVVVELIQRRRGYFDPEKQTQAEALAPDSPAWQKEFCRDFKFRGGCTLLINGETGEVRYCIVKNVLSAARLARQREFTSTPSQTSLRATYEAPTPVGGSREPFALLHRSR
jgi:quinol monooxygenase YgiN